MTEKARVTEGDILQGLREVGLSAGDVVLVHSSLSAFGHVEGGPDTVIDALLEAVGKSGTVVVPTFDWGRAHKAERVTFDLKNTSCRKEMGIIPETFRLREEARRSTHVCHSVAAIGPRTREVLGHGVSSFGAGSTFHALYDHDAWNLLLGVEFTSCTELHAVEEYMRVPYRYHRDYVGSTVILEDGTEVPSDSLEFLRYDGYLNDFGKMRAVLEPHGVLRTTEIGDALVTNVRIRDIFDITREYMERDIGFLLNEPSRERLAAEQDRGPEEPRV
ncbi:MAG: AAC(3) family N-acetyltransferase [Armatimonadota bacterium]|jgi:aminoglycoside 3-N-acetyltransferase